MSPQPDAYFVKGHFGGVGGREVKGAEQYWAVGGGASRLGCLRAREQVRPSPRCRQKRLYPLEWASLGGGGQNNPGLALQSPPLVAFRAFLGGAEERSVGGPSPQRP